AALVLAADLPDTALVLEAELGPMAWVRPSSSWPLAPMEIARRAGVRIAPIRLFSSVSSPASEWQLWHWFRWSWTAACRRRLSRPRGSALRASAEGRQGGRVVAP